ncbi:MAG TPA: hypothetical protein VHU13_03685 [Solirubrobacteraceae bacterium]|jgi:hypothetical protein|nr:hypothetical protein [Solirubrobacteraceae bacterium]
MLAFASYLLLSISLLARTWLSRGVGSHLVGGGGDPLGFVWFLAWLPHALTHGESPFFTHYLMAPQGANLLNSTAVPLPALVLWPITSAFGPVLSYNVLATLAPAASCWVAYLALRQVTTHRSSAWIGGAIYGLGGYMAGQATAHVNLMITVFPPLAWILIEKIRREGHWLRDGALFGLAAAAQVYVNEEVFALTGIVALLAGVLAHFTGCLERRQIARLARASASAAVVFALLAGPSLGYQLYGPEHAHGVVVTSGRYVNDLASFVVPNALQWLSTTGSMSLASGFSGFDGEWGGYLGAPLLCLLAFACWRLRRRTLLPGTLLACVALLSLGPHLRVLGHDTGLLLPWVLPNHLPLLADVVPDRFNLFVWGFAAILFVMVLDDVRARPIAGRPAIGLAACVFALAPILPKLAPVEHVGAPRLLRDGASFRAALPGVQTILIVPAGNGQYAMYAQALSGFSYRIPDGGVFVPGRAGPAYGMREGPLLYALDAVAGTAGARAGQTRMDRRCLGRIGAERALDRACRGFYRAAIAALDLDAVIINRPRSRGARFARLFASLLGRARRDEGMLIFIARPARETG